MKTNSISIGNHASALRPDHRNGVGVSCVSTVVSRTEAGLDAAKDAKGIASVIMAETARAVIICFFMVKPPVM